jgi:Mrp family chromosome partitioning ATPase
MPADKKQQAGTSPTGRLLDLIRGQKADNSQILFKSVRDQSQEACNQPEAKPGGNGGPCGFCRIDVNQKLFGRLQNSLDMLWGNIMLTHGKPPHSIILSGSSPMEGVSLVAQSLCLHLAMEYQSRVLYVNASGQGEHSWPPDNSVTSGGLVDVLFEGGDIASAIMPTNLSGLSVLPYGGVQVKHAHALLIQRPGGLENFVAFTRDNYDYIVCDGKSVLMAPWTVSIAKHMDMVLLVCRYAQSRREVVSRAIETFASGGAKVDGMILNDRQFPIPKVLYNRMK